MADTTVALAPFRLRMSPIHAAVVTIAAATELAGRAAPHDRSLQVAFITAGGGVLAMAIAQTLAYLFNRRKGVDHPAEFANEQAEMASMRTIDHLIDEISDRDRLLAQKDAEIHRLRQRRRPHA